MIPVCFHQRRDILTACWRASTCWMGCLFSSSVLCLCIALSTILSPPSSLPFMMIPCSPCASTFDLPPLFISLLLFFRSLSFSLCSSSLCLSVCLSPCQCSVSCGGGVQARSIQCLRQGRPAAGCLPHQRPVTSRACNTHFCPAAPLAPVQRPSRVTPVGTTLKGKFL